MTSISREFIINLKESIDISDFIGSSLKLKKQGAESVGLCPFHSEKSGSFSVSGSKGLYLCRGCQAKGDVFDFAQNYLGIPFNDAVHVVAKHFGIQVPKIISIEKDAIKEQSELYLLMERVQKLYKAELKKSALAKSYLLNRGINDISIEKYSLGYAPAGNFLQKKIKDVPLSMMEKSGLIHKSNFKDGAMADWMSERIIFPIKSQSGKILAFGGRSITESSKGNKYLNTPETIIFKKGNESYGFFEAASQIRKTETVIIAEGYFDVIIPSANGVGNIVSAMGTALTRNCLEKLYKNANSVIFCFDGDAAGKSAAVRAMEMVVPLIDEHHNANFCFLPDGQDPDDYVIENGGEAFNNALNKSIPLSEFIIKEYSLKNNLNTAEGRAKFSVDTMALISKIKSPFLRAVISDEIRKIVGRHIPLPNIENFKKLSTESTTPEIRKRGFANFQKIATTAEKETIEKKNITLAMRVLSLIIQEPETAKYFEPNWLCLVKSNPNEIQAVEAVVDAIKHNPVVETKESLLARFNGSSIGKMIATASQFQNPNNIFDAPVQLMEIVNFLSDQQIKMAAVSSMFQNKLMHHVE
jgi:DNA primase